MGETGAVSGAEAEYVEGVPASSLRKALPAPPAEILVVARSPEALTHWLAGSGYETTSAEPESLKRGTATKTVVFVYEEEKGASDPCLMLRELAADPGPETLLIVGKVSKGPAEEGGSLARLELALAEHGFAYRPPELIEGVEEDLRLLLRANRTPYRIRGYQEGDEDAIVDLFERSFHHRRGVDHWSWEYQSCPWGGPRVSLAISSEQDLVAHYAGYPVRFLLARSGWHLAAEETSRDGWHLVDAHQIGDTMTAPEVRSVGRGPTSLLSRTARHFFASHCVGKVAFNYGFNVGNIRRFSELFLDAHQIAPVPFRRREVAGKTLRPTGRIRRLLGAEVRKIETPGPEFDDFLREVASSYGFLTERNAEYLRWRYFERPGYDYLTLAAYGRRRLSAWAVFRREGDVLLWGDALVHPGATDLVEPLLAAALASPTGLGCRRIEGWFPERPSFLAETLDRLGFESLSHPQDLSLMCIPFGEADPIPLLRDHLYYTLGDSDLF